MRKFYEKPSLAVESFVTEEVMRRTNVLHSTVLNVDGEEWNFLNAGETGEMHNVLNSVSYDTFTGAGE